MKQKIEVFTEDEAEALRQLEWLHKTHGMSLSDIARRTASRHHTVSRWYNRWAAPSRKSCALLGLLFSEVKGNSEENEK